MLGTITSRPEGGITWRCRLCARKFDVAQVSANELNRVFVHYSSIHPVEWAESMRRARASRKAAGL